VALNHAGTNKHTRPTTEPADETALLMAARAQPEAFAPIYERYVERIYAYCARRVSQEEAEDLTSFIFARALASAHDYRGGSVGAWLFTIAHNVVVNHYRDRRAHALLDDARVPDEHPALLDQVIMTDEHEALRALVGRLPLHEQDMLMMKLVGELNASEIGALVGKSAGAVRTELHRIIDRLRSAMTAQERLK
jgi:RNA polymerase sigma-70 factor (ECF subfamily)